MKNAIGGRAILAYVKRAKKKQNACHEFFIKKYFYYFSVKIVEFSVHFFWVMPEKCLHKKLQQTRSATLHWAKETNVGQMVKNSLESQILGYLLPKNICAFHCK